MRIPSICSYTGRCANSHRRVVDRSSTLALHVGIEKMLENSYLEAVKRFEDNSVRRKLRFLLQM